MQEKEILVEWESEIIQGGLLSMEQIVNAFLEVHALASKKPKITVAPHFEHEDDWSDYEYRHQTFSFTWGDKNHLVKALSPQRFEITGIPQHAYVFWVFHGLPAGCEWSGQTEFPAKGKSCAVLRMKGKGPKKRAETLFRKMLFIDPEQIAHFQQIAKQPNPIRISEAIQPPTFPDAINPPAKALSQSAETPAWDAYENVSIPIRPISAVQVYERLITYHRLLFDAFGAEADGLQWQSEQTVSKERPDQWKGKALRDECRSIPCQNDYLVFSFQVNQLWAEEQWLWTSVYFQLIKTTRVIGFNVEVTEKPAQPIQALMLHRAFITEDQANKLWLALRSILE